MLQGKTVLITGASKGIGEATAKLIYENGASLVLLSRNLDRLNQIKDELLVNKQGEVYCFKTDVRNHDEIISVFDSLKSNKIIIDAVVNNAGIMEDATLSMVQDDSIERIYQTNVFSSFYVCQLAIKHLVRKRKGSIINLSSIIGTNGNSGQTVYGSSKTAMIGFTKSLSKELAPLNIRVNAVAPGFIDTDMTKDMNEDFYQKNVNSIGMRRIGKPMDVAKVILFLVSDMSEYVTGQVIGVDGGMII
jgi:3-oxoacyl-[acyl-carrier protein] reductase